MKIWSCGVLSALSMILVAGCGGGGSEAGNSISPSSTNSSASSSSSSVASVGKYLFIPNLGSDSITGYAINASTGALTPLPGAPFATGVRPSSLRVHPSGKFLYSANTGSGTISGTVNPSVSAFVLDSTTGALTPISGSPFTVGAVGAIERPFFDLTGSFMYVGRPSLAQINGFAVNSSTGALSSLPINSLPRVIVTGLMNSVNGLYYVPTITSISGNDVATVSVYSINSTSGLGTLLSSTPTGQGSISSGVFRDPTGKFLYAMDISARAVVAFTIDPTTGLLTVSSPSVSTGIMFLGSIAMDPAGKFMFMLDTNPTNTSPAGNSSILAFSINSTTGALTAVGSPVSTGGTGGMGLQTYMNGSYLLVTNRTSGSVAIFGINQTTGALTPAVGSPFTTPGTSPGAVTIDPSGKFAYLPDSVSATITQFTINASAGTLTVGNTYPTGTTPGTAVVTGLQ